MSHIASSPLLWLRALLSPSSVALYALSGGAAALVYGVLLLAGPGWSFIAGGALALTTGVLVVRGAGHE